MRFDIMVAVFIKEVREMLRDRRSLAVMFGLPLVLYPMLAIGISALVKTKTTQLKANKDRVTVVNAAAAPNLVTRLSADSVTLQVVDPPADPKAALRQGGERGLEAIITVPPDFEKKALAGEAATIDVAMDRSRTSADFVRRKIDKAIDAYQRWIIEQRLTARGVPKELLEPIKVETTDLASGNERFGRILAGSLPVLLLMTGMLGALFPALNATTTERELGTLETLLVTPIGRTELLLAKGALVLLCSLLTSGLNLLSMSLVLLRSLTMVQPDLASQFSISAQSLFLSYLAAAPALVFFAALVLIVGLIARNFREANAFATPAMLLPLAAMAIGIAEPKTTPALLVTPVASTTLIIRDVLTSHVSFGAFALAWVSSLIYAGLMLSVAARLFNSEQLVNPAWEPLSLGGLRGAGRAARNRPRRLPAIDEAVALFLLCLLLLFYVSPSWQKYGLYPTVAGNELLLILAPTLLLAWLARWKWAETFQLFAADPRMWIGAAVLAVGLTPWAQWLYALQDGVWPQDPEMKRMTSELIGQPLVMHPLLTISLVGTLAGVCEEALFRGPIQTAFLRRLPVGAAILVTALLFGAMHIDLHGLPIRTLLGAGLGWIAWRGRSIFPAMLAHGLYDSTSLTLAWWGQRSGQAAEATTRLTGSEMAMLAVGAVLMIVGFVLCRPTRVADPTDVHGRFEVGPSRTS